MRMTGADMSQAVLAPEQNLNLEDFSIDELLDLMQYMTPEERTMFDDLLKSAPPRSLMPHQMVPHNQSWWEIMLLVGGRGTGKTVTGASEARNHLRLLGKNARIGIGAPTNADARDTCMEGETGLIRMFPNEFKYYNRSLGEAQHIGGGIVKAMGTEKPGRWNGPQWSMIWFDELALCQQAAWDDANLGLRLGKRPYGIATTTPKNKKWVRKLAEDPTTYVPQYVDENGKRRLPTTFDNEFLPQRRVEWLRRKFGGSRIGRQELDGAFLDDIEGAMWKREWIERNRIVDHDRLPRMSRIIISIDPAGSSARMAADKNALTEEQRLNQSKNAQTAICVMGLGIDGKLYVLAIRAAYWRAEEWSVEAIKMFHQYRADMIIAERNYGGDMVEATLRAVDIKDKETGKQLKGRSLPIKVVTASKGKHIRAQPIATLYEQNRVVHCAEFPDAEDQMCAFIDADDNEGADMVDAIVWAGIELVGMDEGYGRIIVSQADPRMRSFIVM